MSPCHARAPPPSPLPWCTIKCLFLPPSLAFLILTGVRGAEGGLGTNACFRVGSGQYSCGCWLGNWGVDIQSVS